MRTANLVQRCHRRARPLHRDPWIAYDVQGRCGRGRGAAEAYTRNTDRTGKVHSLAG